MRKLRTTILAGVTMITAPAFAVDIPVEFRQVAMRSSEAESMWADKIAVAQNPDGEAGSTSTVFVATIPSASGQYTVTMIGDPALCGFNDCPVRVFADQQLVFDASACASSQGYVLRPDALQIVACDDPLDLRPVDTR